MNICNQWIAENPRVSQRNAVERDNTKQSVVQTRMTKKVIPMKGRSFVLSDFGKFASQLLAEAVMFYFVSFVER